MLLAKGEQQKAREIEKHCDALGIPLIPQGSPAEIVMKWLGSDFVVPFTHELHNWTNGKWPREGSFDPEKFRIAELLINGLSKNALTKKG